eukprot:GGOE01018548.1.p1 GENE.GGOE01018548.1~~GGOE01018548.1.p1  ORF type:complete len:921 (+),score=152.44 GGOE01018548.1:28-2790(+)
MSLDIAGQLDDTETLSGLKAALQALQETPYPDAAMVDDLASRLNIEAAKQIQSGGYDTAFWLLNNVDALTAHQERKQLAHHRRTMLNNFGCLEQKRGRPEAAYAYMSQAIALGCADNPHVLLNAVAVLEKLDKHPEVAVGYARVCIRLLEDQMRAAPPSVAPKAQQKAAYMLTLARFHLARALDRSVRSDRGGTTCAETVGQEYSTALQLATAWLGATHPTTLKVRKHVQAYQRKQGGADSEEVPEGDAPIVAIQYPVPVSAPTPLVGEEGFSPNLTGVPAPALKQCNPSSSSKGPSQLQPSSPPTSHRQRSSSLEGRTHMPWQPSPTLPDISRVALIGPPSGGPDLAMAARSPLCPPTDRTATPSPSLSGAATPHGGPQPPSSSSCQLHPGGPGRRPLVLPPQPSASLATAVPPQDAASVMSHSLALPTSCPAEPLPEPHPMMGGAALPRRPQSRAAASESPDHSGGSPVEVAQHFVVHSRLESQVTASQPGASPPNVNASLSDQSNGSPVSSAMRHSRSPMADRTQSPRATAPTSPSFPQAAANVPQKSPVGLSTPEVDLHGLQCMLRDLSGLPEEGLTNYYLDSNNRLWAGEQGRRQKEREVRVALERSLRLLTTENEVLRHQLLQLQQQQQPLRGDTTVDTAAQTTTVPGRACSPCSPQFGPVLETFAQSLQSSFSAALPVAHPGSPELSPLKVGPRYASDGPGHTSPLHSEGPSHVGTWYDDLPYHEGLPVPPVFLQPALPPSLLLHSSPPTTRPPRSQEAPADRSRWRSFSLDEQRHGIVYPTVLDLSPVRGRDQGATVSQRRAKSARQWSSAGRSRPTHFPIDQRLAQHLQAIHQGKEPPPPPPDASSSIPPVPSKSTRGHRPCTAHPVRSAPARQVASSAAALRTRGGRESDPDAWRRLYQQTPHSLRGDWM